MKHFIIRKTILIFTFSILANINPLLAFDNPNEKLTALKKPNIIFILADDLGIRDVRCYNADNYKTPNIDKLTNTRIRFTNVYIALLCGLSRAMILTGRHLFRTGATN